MRTSLTHSSLALAGGLALFSCSSGDGPSPPPPEDGGPRALAIASVEDLGGFSAPASVVGRDGTSSALVGSRVLWTFGDTFLGAPDDVDGNTLLSATGGWSTVADPLALTEPLHGMGVPYQLVPYTADEIAENTKDLQTGVALWPGPVFAASDTEATVLFQHVLRTGGGSFDFMTDAIGVSTLEVGKTEGTRAPGFLFQSPDPLFGGGGSTTSGGDAYLYDCEQTFITFHCKVGRAPVARVGTRSAYEFWDGAGWTADVTQAAWFIDQVSSAISIEYNPWLRRWLAVSSAVLSNDITFQTADALTGPWGGAITLSGDTPGIVTGPAGTNYLAAEHVELQANGGKEVVLGYAHPLPNFGGDPHLARVTLR